MLVFNIKVQKITLKHKAKNEQLYEITLLYKLQTRGKITLLH